MATKKAATKGDKGKSGPTYGAKSTAPKKAPAKKTTKKAGRGR